MAERLAAWEASEDRRRIFLDCYMRMTRNMLTAIEQGRFDDAQWVTRLLHHFAGYYFDAVDACERAADEPPVWAHALQASASPRTTVLQNLLLGINAHINYDLVLALSDVLAPEWESASDAVKRRRYHDHSLVNRIIAETVDEVQDEVVERHSPAMDLVDKMAGPIDEWAASWFIGVWREEVWQNAIEMTSCCAQHDREDLRRRVELKAMERARLLLLV